jgi:hypothetical protein
MAQVRGEVETLTPPCIISIMGHERSFLLCLSSINSKVFNHSFRSFGLQQVSIESHPFQPLIL